MRCRHVVERPFNFSSANALLIICTDMSGHERSADRESKTEEPTQKRIMDALRKGKGPSSRELPLLFNFGAIWLIFAVFLGANSSKVAAMLQLFFENPGAWPLHLAGDAVGILNYVTFQVLAALLPLLGIIALGGLMASLPQSNGIVLERIKPDLSRISLSAGWKRTFGKAGLMNALKSILKLGIVATVAFWSLRSLSKTVMVEGYLEVEGQMQVIVGAVGSVVGGVFLVFVLIALLDGLMVWITWLRGLRMTKQEVKDEAKESEGDPAVKQRQRLIGRRRAKQRMMLAVPRATVVIVNPTHYAVALRYVPAEAGAARMLAKGQDRVALRIRAMAEELRIPVIEDRWLADPPRSGSRRCRHSRPNSTRRSRGSLRR